MRTVLGIDPGKDGAAVLLVGESDHMALMLAPIVGGKRWDSRQKQIIRDSRTESTRVLTEALVALPPAGRPRVLVSASGDRTVRVFDLIDGSLLDTFTLDPYFRLDGDRVAFRANAGGVTTSGSDFARSELREMTADGAEKASWSTTSGVHTLTITQAVTHLPDVVPHLVAGQVHGGSAAGPGA
jgi:WD40 repeat protein